MGGQKGKELWKDFKDWSVDIIREWCNYAVLLSLKLLKKILLCFDWLDCLWVAAIVGQLEKMSLQKAWVYTIKFGLRDPEWRLGVDHNVLPCSKIVLWLHQQVEGQLCSALLVKSCDIFKGRRWRRNHVSAVITPCSVGKQHCQTRLFSQDRLNKVINRTWWKLWIMGGKLTRLSQKKRTILWMTFLRLGADKWLILKKKKILPKLRFPEKENWTTAYSRCLPEGST